MNIKKTLVFSLFVGSFVLALQSLAVAGDKSTLLYNEGNKLYRNKEFKKAEALYTKALSTGIKNGNLYYNLANSCFKQKKYGKARLYYEKALKLMPQDKEVRENLKTLLLILDDKVNEEDGSFLSQLFQNVLNIASVSTWVYCVDVFYLILCGVFIYSFLLKHKKPKGVILWGSVICFGLSGILLGGKIINEWDTQAIVMQKELEVKSAPQQSYPTIFKIHKGAKVLLVEKRKDWVFIKLGNKLRGWIPVNSIESI